MKTIECDTPALLIDMDAAERNIRRMADYLHGKKANLRAHTKVHKSPFLAHKQLAAGSKGITCAKLGEAEVMAQSGIDDILIANEIVGEGKIDRLARLAKYSKVMVAVDSIQNAKQISLIASRHDSRIGVLVDLNLAAGLDGILDRCGVRPGPDAVGLANELSKLQNLEFRGLMGYEGGMPNLEDLEKSRAITKTAVDLLVETKESIEESGLDVEVVSSAGTTSYRVAAEHAGVTEIQAGSYILMDVFHQRFSPEFEYALSVLTTVISVPSHQRMIVDAGGTAISGDAGLPIVKDRSDLEVVELDAEHIHVKSKDPRKKELAIGDRLELLPTNIDTTTCLHDQYVVSRKGDVEAYLSIPARGKFQ